MVSAQIIFGRILLLAYNGSADIRSQESGVRSQKSEEQLDRTSDPAKAESINL